MNYTVTNVKILLLFPPNTHRGETASHLVSNIESVYPLGIGYIAAVLEKEGHDVHFLDCQFPWNNDEKILKTIQDKGIEVVGVGSSTPNSYQAYDLIRLVKKNFPDIHTIFGGPHVVAVGPIIFKECPEVDYIVYGEGELIIKELVKALEDGESVEEILGIAYKKGDEVKVNPRRPYIEDLDSLPYPAYHLAEMDKYKPVGGMFRKLPFANMITTRGCPYNCIFCCKINWGRICRMRSVDNILGEIDLLVDKYKVKEIAFFDDTFTLKRDRVVEFCNKLMEKHPNLIWKCSSRVNHVDLDLLKLMRKAGCYSIGYGIESGDNQILKNIRKGITVELSRQAIAWTKQVGMETRGYYMLNNLGDTRETIEKTIQFSRELDTDFLDFEIVHPYPGSELWDVLPKMPEIKIINKEKWTDWNTQAGHYIMFLQNDLTEEYLKDAYRRANTGYYLRPMKMLKMAKIALSNKNMFLASLRAFRNLINVKAKGMED